jgi:hypothetical protein
MLHSPRYVVAKAGVTHQDIHGGTVAVIASLLDSFPVIASPITNGLIEQVRLIL